jgi:mono/diheme cytochrome c family protein
MFTVMLLFITLVMVGCPDKKATESFVEKNYDLADLIRGGQLYDKWWKVNGQPEPTSDFDPIWSSQSTNSRSGGDTWRCKECHGWDYIGLNGRYSSGSHYTGFQGVWDQRNGHMEDVFDAIKSEGGDHDLAAVLSDVDIVDLTKFMIEGLVDMSLYIGTDGTATGNAENGQQLYNDNCSSCHGLDGDAINFHGDEHEVQAVGWLANDNPQETLHKIRWGHPGSSMPSAVVDGGLSDSQTGDILAYAQTLPGSVKLGNADMKRGGQLYDKWWKVNGQPEPTTDFDPIWASQSTNSRSGSTSWRCKECHGWDYIGLDGRYSSGSHFTGFEGVWDARNNSETDIFNAIKDAGGDHDLSALLDDNDIWNLTSFITGGLVDMSQYIGPDGSATGNVANGEALYSTNCAACHGADGNTFDFEGEDGVQGVGWLANDNPQETLHKIRWGHPGSLMTSGVVDSGYTDDETGDILAYAQSLE